MTGTKSLGKQADRCDRACFWGCGQYPIASCEGALGRRQVVAGHEHLAGWRIVGVKRRVERQRNGQFDLQRSVRRLFKHFKTRHDWAFGQLRQFRIFDKTTGDVFPGDDDTREFRQAVQELATRLEFQER